MLTLVAFVLLADTIDSGAQQGLSHVGALLAGVFIPKLFEYLNKRVDARVQTLEEKVAACEAHRDECTKLKTDYDALKVTVDGILARAVLHHPDDTSETGEHKALPPTSA